MLSKIGQTTIIPAVVGHPAQSASMDCPPPDPGVYSTPGSGNSGGPIPTCVTIIFNESGVPVEYIAC